MHFPNRLPRRPPRLAATFAAARRLAAPALATLLLAAGAASAVDVPTLKSGSWEVSRQTPDQGKDRHVTTMCLDDSVQAQMRDFGMGMAKDMCSKNEMRNEGNRVLSTATCKMGTTTMTTRSTMTFNGTSSYHTEIEAKYDPPMANMRESKTVLDGKWTGPCKPGEKPGDITLEGGQKLNMKSMMSK